MNQSGRIRFSIFDIDQNTRRIVGTYRGPEGMCRLDAVFDRSKYQTHITYLKGAAPCDFLDKAVEYFAANKIPLPNGDQEGL